MYGDNYIIIDSTFGVASKNYNPKLTAVMVMNKYGNNVCYLIRNQINDKV